MNVKKLLFVIAFTLCGVAMTQAQQDYKMAIGVRLGYPLSASFKTFISEKGAVEAYAGFRGYTGYKWFHIGGLYQHHFPIGSIENFAWYVGGGANVFFWSYDAGFTGSSTTFGVAGCGGVDYKFKNIPLNLSADWVPIYFIGGDYLTGFAGGYGGLAARYTFGK